MFSIISFFLANIVYSFLQGTPEPNTSSIRQLDVRYHIEFFFQDEKVLINDNKFSIYYDGDWRLYKLRYFFDSTLNGKLLKEGYYSYYLVFKKGDKYGYRFDPMAPKNNGSAKIDSLINKHALGGFTWDKITALTPVSTYDATTDVLEEIYSPAGIDDNKDTLKFYYSNRFKDYEFSFSRTLDSLKQLKLFKIVAYNAPFYYKETNKNFPERTSYFIMEEGKQEDLELVEHYFREYRKMKRPGDK